MHEKIMKSSNKLYLLLIERFHSPNLKILFTMEMIEFGNCNPMRNWK